jgi:hypothetical protein
MIEHGIFTSRADVWAHLFPLEQAVYVYRVSIMRWWINYIRTTHSYRGKIAGYSKGSGNATGLGELVPKQKVWIKKHFVPKTYLAGHNWENGTDRENGTRGQIVGKNLLSDGMIELPLVWISRAVSREEQNSAVDYRAKLAIEIAIEFKTETVKSENLFVQTDEYNHNPHITRRSFERKETAFPRESP